MSFPQIDYGPIVGCWTMFEAWNSTGDSGSPPLIYPWGDPPLGYWVYDPAGNASVQISINPPLSNLGNSWWSDSPVACNEMLDSFNNYMAYFGTYTVDYSTWTVTVNVTTDVLRQYTGTPQPRPFQLHDNNNELWIGDNVTYLRKFRRVASFGAHSGGAMPGRRLSQE